MREQISSNLTGKGLCKLKSKMNFLREKNSLGNTQSKVEESQEVSGMCCLKIFLVKYFTV